MIIKNITITILFLLIGFTSCFSQEINTSKASVAKNKIEKPSIVKINSLALLFNNASVIYERAITPKLSAGIGVGYKYSGGIPRLFKTENSAFNIEYGNIVGLTITPEVRYYLKSCNPFQLEGLYVGLYTRYTGYSTYADFENNLEDGVTEFYTSDLTLSEFGAGLQLGYQLIVKNRFSIDFLFWGPRFSRFLFTYEFDQEPSPEFLEDLSDDLNEVIDRFGLGYTVNLSQAGEASAKTRFSIVNLRVGLSLGYAF